MSKLYVTKDPLGHDLSFFPEDVRMCLPVSLPPKDAPQVVDPATNKPLPIKGEYREDCCGMVIEGLSQPLVVGLSVREASRIINNPHKPVGVEE